MWLVFYKGIIYNANFWLISEIISKRKSSQNIDADFTLFKFCPIDWIQGDWQISVDGFGFGLGFGVGFGNVSTNKNGGFVGSNYFLAFNEWGDQ